MSYWGSESSDQARRKANRLLKSCRLRIQYLTGQVEAFKNRQKTEASTIENLNRQIAALKKEKALITVTDLQGILLAIRVLKKTDQQFDEALNKVRA